MGLCTTSSCAGCAVRMYVWESNDAWLAAWVSCEGVHIGPSTLRLFPFTLLSCLSTWKLQGTRVRQPRWASSGLNEEEQGLDDRPLETSRIHVHLSEP